MGAMTVLDTDVFIDHFRGLQAATAYLQSFEVGQRATTDITVMELYRGAANSDELSTIEQFLTRNHFTFLPVSVSTSPQAVHLVKRYTLSHGLGLPDALIAAIVLAADHTLITGNVRHFAFIEGVRVVRPPYRPQLA
jgi:predicted nucleic acid-binding protein